MLIMDTLARTLSWFQKAVPIPESKNLHTQLGCHFEEINETLMCVSTRNFETQILIDTAKAALNALANHLKSEDGVIFIKPEDRLELLDGFCDQIVTGVGCAHMFDVDIIGGMEEVNRSNFSKFDETGEPIFNENKKVMKGPGYTKPDLAAFV